MQFAYAYFLVYFGILLEGELALLAASLGAYRGLLDIRLVALTAFIGTLTTDWSFFFMGRLLGSKVFKWFPKLQGHTDKPRLWMRKNPVLILAFYRFLYGFRILTLLLLGMSHVSIKKFMFYSFFAIIVWTTIFSFLGYYLGEIINQMLHRYQNLGIYIVTGLLSAIILLYLVRSLVRKALKTE
ncbi:MAG: VTT domain-containing protein [Bacteroidales bacterium]|nr:VTT domain-containing protein [Bacteroidales bacterium]